MPNTYHDYSNVTTVYHLLISKLETHLKTNFHQLKSNLMNDEVLQICSHLRLWFEILYTELECYYYRLAIN